MGILLRYASASELPVITRIKVILLSGDFKSFWKEFLGKYALEM
jgi:hypothetical protein